MRTSNLRAAVVFGGTFLVVTLLSFGCGNPEAPQITSVRLSYWDSLTGEGEWVALDDGEAAPQSPVRIQGNITDNTAVVNPWIVWVGERGDVDEGGFVECAGGDKEFYECEMECAGPTPDGFFTCTPALDARKLIRGDQFKLTGTQADGEAFEVDVSLSEGQALTVGEDEVGVETEYRAFRILSVEGDAGLVWSVYWKTTDCRRWNPETESCDVAGSSGDWRTLRSGDNLCWHPAAEEPNCLLQIALKQMDGETAVDSVSASFSSLVKWNDEGYLNWDATTGDFVEEFQIFDPRLRHSDSGEVIGDADPSTFRYVVSAEDVPDQKTEQFRYSETARELVFRPEPATLAPDLQVDGEDEELVETSVSAENISGTVKSFSGEVRSLALRLSDGPEGVGSRLLYFRPSAISLLGDFTATLVYVSDWDGNGVVDEWSEEEGITNTLDAVALDVLGHWTFTTVPIEFFPSTSSDGPPELQILEIFPAVDEDQEALLPFGEELRVRSRAADDRGQPAFSAYECACAAAEPLINEDRCPCAALTGVKESPVQELHQVDLNAGGEYPRNPWEWIVVKPDSEIQATIGVLRATEKVDEEQDKPEAKFSGIEIGLEPDPEEGDYRMKVFLPETAGPNVILSGLENGQFVDPNGLVVEATIFANVSELNQIKALWNGEPRGTPTYDNETGVFLWDLQESTVREGDRICVGAISVTGHATLYILEFADTSDGLLLGLTLTSDTRECVQLP